MSLCLIKSLPPTHLQNLGPLTWDFGWRGIFCVISCFIAYNKQNIKTPPDPSPPLDCSVSALEMLIDGMLTQRLGLIVPITTFIDLAILYFRGQDSPDWNLEYWFQKIFRNCDFWTFWNIDSKFRSRNKSVPSIRLRVFQNRISHTSDINSVCLPAKRIFHIKSY